MVQHPLFHKKEVRRKGDVRLNELFILGELMNNPMHGYLLHQILNAIVGTRKISWGALYPLIHSMLADGLIEQVTKNNRRALGGEKEKRKRFTNLQMKVESGFSG